MPFAFFLLTMLSSISVFAALGTNANSAMLFYRSRESLFPSGQASRNELENKQLSTEIEFSYRVAWDKRSFSIEAEDLLRDIQTAHYADTKSDYPLLSEKRRDSRTIKKLAAKTSLEILNADSYWAEVKEKNGTATGWIPLHLLQAHNEDLGVYVSLMDTYLRKKPEIPSGIVTTVPRLRRVIPLSIENGFLKISYENQIGYADINNFVNRADFANLAYCNKYGWFPVSYRNGEYIIGKSGEKVSLENILGYVTNTHRGIVTSSVGKDGPRLRSRVEIVKPQANVWAISRIEGHGDVWWKKNNLLLEGLEKPAGNSLSTDELMKRPIYSIAFENKESLRGIVSSEGVYCTEDGLTWTQIPQFGKQNYPVNIHPNGTWFVGSYKSVNGGKSFDPFIRWEQIADAIEASIHRNPRLMRLTQIEALPHSRIQIRVDTGGSKITLRSSIQGGPWSVIQ